MQNTNESKEDKGTMTDEEISIAAYEIFVMYKDDRLAMTREDEADFAESLFDDIF